MFSLDCLLFVKPVWISRFSCIVSHMPNFYHHYIWVPIISVYIKFGKNRYQNRRKS